MKLLLLLMLIVHVGSSSGNDEEDHNKDAHNALCDILHAVVAMSKSSTVSDTLRKALHRTIFGNESGGQVGDLKNKLLGYYQLENRYSSRPFLCAQPSQEKVNSKEHHPLWPGHSAPHDMVCLCTLGDGGWPLRGTDAGKKKLCGKQGDQLGLDIGKQGWGYQVKEGEKQIQATWTNVVDECLQGTDKGTKLKDSLKTFIEKLGTVNSEANTYKVLGESGSGDYPCSGSKMQGVCVKYYPEEQNAIPWWMELQNAIKTEEEETEKQSKEEKRKQQEEKQRKAQNQEDSQPQYAPRTAALKSAKQEKQEVEQTNPENISATLTTLEETSGTLIIPPSSWLLSTFLLI
ncbi:Variant surface glycoprotein [Trypanosoma congolense IL3000]|uniref:Variant surface glycoprotein n=1 Tax=Trypanosoma congolense (strain IL3000) TaxID=1068625 RepID=F9WBM6_TRYCI|nr:Variant surface glycoprotein [Trypanosoma congolense IL3000]